MLLSLFGTRWLITFFANLGKGQPILGAEDHGPVHQMGKQGTPTMGGIAILVSGLIGWTVAHLRDGLPFSDQAAIIWLTWRAWQVKDLRDLIVQAFQATMRITSMVAFILVGATCFSIAFAGVDGNLWVEHLLTGLPGGVWGFLAVVNVFVFFLAFFLDFFEIAFIIIPLLAPVADKLGIDLIWFGVLVCANIQTSFMHPPFGFALFYIRGIAPPSVRSSDIYMGAIPWVILQVILVVILIVFPQTVTYLLDKPAVIDPAKIEEQLRSLPGLDLPPPPSFDLTPPRIQ